MLLFVMYVAKYNSNKYMISVNGKVEITRPDQTLNNWDQVDQIPLPNISITTKPRAQDHKTQEASVTRYSLIQKKKWINLC